MTSGGVFFEAVSAEVLVLYFFRSSFERFVYAEIFETGESRAHWTDSFEVTHLHTAAIFYVDFRQN